MLADAIGLLYWNDDIRVPAIDVNHQGQEQSCFLMSKWRRYVTEGLRNGYAEGRQTSVRDQRLCDEGGRRQSMDIESEGHNKVSGIG